MSQEDVEDYRLLLADPVAARARWDEGREDMFATSASELTQALRSFSPCQSCFFTASRTGLCPSVTPNGWQHTSPG
jgi:hypothetical protein